MKKLIILVLGLILLIFLGYYAFNLSASDSSSDEQVAALNFEIKDTSSIAKIIITEPNGMEVVLVRGENGWAGEKGECIQQQPITNILDAAYNVRFKGYIPENSMKTVVNRMATIGTKVQFFDADDWLKTWYIGSSTPDHYGTYMLVESEESGKSDLPVITEIKGLKGIIGPRFFADIRRWSCTEMFAYEKNEIAFVSVNYSEKRERNFQVKKQGNNYLVTTNGKRFPTLDTSNVYRYLMNFKNIHFEYPNFELSDKQVDSVLKSKPFCELTVKSTKGKTTKLKCFRRKSDTGKPLVDDFGDTVMYDSNRMWCLMPNKQLVKCQNFVFGPLLNGSIYFNYPVGKP